MFECWVRSITSWVSFLADFFLFFNQFGTSETSPTLPRYVNPNPRIRLGYGESTTQPTEDWSDCPGYAASDRQHFSSEVDSENAYGGTKKYENDVSSFGFPSSDSTETQVQVSSLRRLRRATGFFSFAALPSRVAIE